MSAFVSRGFQRRHRPPDELAERLPPGHYLEPEITPSESGDVSRLAGPPDPVLRAALTPLAAIGRMRGYSPQPPVSLTARR